MSASEEILLSSFLFLAMSKSKGMLGEARGSGETTTEAYDEELEAGAGACAADYWAGPGVSRPVFDENGVRVKKTKKSSSRKMEKRILKLEKALKEKKSRGRTEKRPSKVKRDPSPDPSDNSGGSDSSDSSSDSSRSSSSSSSSSSDRYSSPEKKSSSKKKRSKYSRKHQIKDKKVIESSMELVVYLVRLLRRCHKKGKEIGGLIEHLLVMVEKSEKEVYSLESMIGYDDECRDLANEKGVKSFGKIRPTSVLKFLSYDCTNVAKRQAAQKAGNKKPTQPAAKGCCFGFNGQAGCDGVGCAFKHQCMFCGDSSHGSMSCRKGKSTSKKSTKGN